MSTNVQMSSEDETSSFNTDPEFQRFICVRSEAWGCSSSSPPVSTCQTPDNGEEKMLAVEKRMSLSGETCVGGERGLRRYQMTSALRAVSCCISPWHLQIKFVLRRGAGRVGVEGGGGDEDEAP